MSNNTLTLAEFLQSEDYEPPKLGRKAIVYRHCHQYAVMGFEAEQELYGKMGLDYEVLDSGCCGLAGLQAQNRMTAAPLTVSLRSLY